MTYPFKKLKLKQDHVMYTQRPMHYYFNLCASLIEKFDVSKVLGMVKLNSFSSLHWSKNRHAS